MPDIYDAIANPTRRKMIGLLADVDELPLHALVDHFPMGRTAVSKHLAVLEEVNLVKNRRVSRETRYRLNAAPLAVVKDWVSRYEDFWNDKMKNLKNLLQEEQMKPDVSLDFQFDSSIEQVWFALTDSDTLAKWIWDNDFKPVVGHKFQFRDPAAQGWSGVVDGEVLEVDKPHRLSFTWNSGIHTTVTLTLEETDGTVHLHLEQSGFDGVQQAIQGAVYGWKNLYGQLEEVLAEL